MSKKSFLLLALQVVVIGAFIMIAAGSSSNSNLTPQQAYDAGYSIGSGIGTLINN